VKVLVGTLYSGESEFDECVAAIRGQTFKDFDHVIIKDLPQIEAHHVLYKSFLRKATEYGLLIKVDADTVITSDYLFEGIVEKFFRNDWLDVMNIGVTDFFTGSMIPAGIQVYRNTVRWDFETETLFPDIPESPKERHYYDTTELAPAALHIKNPSPYQAFHYGVHRGLKALARIHSTTHWENLNQVWRNFERTGDVRVGLAALGAELVYAGKLKKPDADYTNPKMKMVLAKYETMSNRDLAREIRRLSARNWGVLPGDLRRRTIRALRSESVSRGIFDELVLLASQTTRRIRRRCQIVTDSVRHGE